VVGFDWGHQSTEAAAIPSAHAGRGVKIAVIDSGIAPHGSLQVAGGRNFLVDEDPQAWDQDRGGHGTHCAGVIAAVHKAASIWGYVPHATLYALRVFGGPDGGGYASDIRDAIRWAIRQECDLINLSLGSQIASNFLRMALEEATDAGVLCVAAAGNASGPVDFPARLNNVVAVSAIGKVGTYPRDSTHRDAQGRIRGTDQVHFFAGFSNWGNEVDLCAPGVAITSTLPHDTFGAWDGTSMGCPHITGIAALALQLSPDLVPARRDAERTMTVLDRLLSCCVDVGMARVYQGAGLPMISRLLRP
jgi:subtilisin family serine protease